MPSTKSTKKRKAPAKKAAKKRTSAKRSTATHKPDCKCAVCKARRRREVAAAEAGAPTVERETPATPAAAPGVDQDSPGLELDQARGLVMSGDAGDEVRELAQLLDACGYKCDITEGRNPHAAFGPSIAGAIAAFRKAEGIEEDAELIKATLPSVVGPTTWAALFKGAEKAAA